MCEEQNGFFHLNSLTTFTVPCTNNFELVDMVTLHHMVKYSGLPNFMGCQIPLQSQLHIPAWKNYLQDDWDQQLLDLLESASL